MGIFNATCDISTILKLFEFNDQLNALHVHLSDVLCGIQLQIHWKFHSLFRFPMKFWIRNSELDKRLWIGKSPMYKHPSQNWKEAYSDPLFRWIKFVVLLESQLKNFRQWRERLLNFLSYGQQYIAQFLFLTNRLKKPSMMNWMLLKIVKEELNTWKQELLEV